jgi:hypothetical protein
MGCDIHPYVEVRKNGLWVKSDVKVPDGRNYWAFGKLANVRNGEGFAGCDTGDAVRPISEPRGLPADTSIRDNNAEYDSPDSVWLGDHSYSWVTLDELLAIDLDATITQRGMVSPEQAKAFRERGEHPDSWCGWTSDTSAVQIEWKVPLRKGAWLLPQIIEAIKGLGEPQDVRLVFGFDS